jgi:CPA2 family monovalent cation:H+ antiporter-2
MEGHGTDITSLAIVVLVALLCGIVMRRIRQPAVLGYIVAGVLLGPSGFELVGDRAGIHLLAELGVLMLLFIIGMELSLQGIRAVWKVALFTTLIQIAVGLGITYLLGAVLDWPLTHIIVLGFSLALSSTAVAIKMLDEIKEKHTRIGQVTIGILIAQDLAVVPMMLVVGAMSGAEEGMSLAGIAKALLSIVFLGLLIVYLSRRDPLRLGFVRNLTTSPDLMPLAGLAFCFGAATVSGLLGLSAAYGAFVAGLVIGNSKTRTAMVRHSLPLQSVLLMVFFLSIGLLLDVHYIWEHLWTVLFIVTFVAVFKTALNIVAIRMLGETWPRAFLCGALLAQMGEFSFVLAALALSNGAIGDSEHRLLVAVTVISLMGSPIWLEAARRLRRVVLLGITSGTETVRLTLGPEASAIFRSSITVEERMVSMAGSGSRWVGDLLPRRDRNGPGRGP